MIIPPVLVQPIQMTTAMTTVLLRGEKQTIQMMTVMMTAMTMARKFLREEQMVLVMIPPRLERLPQPLLLALSLLALLEFRLLAAKPATFQFLLSLRILNLPRPLSSVVRFCLWRRHLPLPPPPHPLLHHLFFPVPSQPTRLVQLRPLLRPPLQRMES